MYKALISFTGVISMSIGEVGEITDPAVVQDLLDAGYVEAVKEDKPKKATKKSPKGE